MEIGLCFGLEMYRSIQKVILFDRRDDLIMCTDEKTIRQKWNFKKLFIEYLNVIFFFKYFRIIDWNKIKIYKILNF